MMASQDSPSGGKEWGKCIVSLPSSINSLWIALALGSKVGCGLCFCGCSAGKPFTSPESMGKTWGGRQERSTSNRYKPRCCQQVCLKDVRVSVLPRDWTGKRWTWPERWLMNTQSIFGNRNWSLHKHFQTTSFKMVSKQLFKEFIFIVKPACVYLGIVSCNILQYIDIKEQGMVPLKTANWIEESQLLKSWD